MSETGKKMYRREDVDAARVNKKKQKDCAKGVQELFEDCPKEKTTAKDANRWLHGYAGKLPDYIYRIPLDWPPEDQILRDEPQPEPAAFERFKVRCGDSAEVSVIYRLWGKAMGQTTFDYSENPNIDRFLYARAEPASFIADSDSKGFGACSFPEIIYPEAIARLQAAIDAQRPDELAWPEWAVWVYGENDKICFLSDAEPSLVSGGKVCNRFRRTNQKPASA
jgi:hypothetical protein